MVCNTSSTPFPPVILAVGLIGLTLIAASSVAAQPQPSSAAAHPLLQAKSKIDPPAWPTPGLSEKSRQCLVLAAQWHGVNVSVLGAIALHESRGNPRTLVKNTNGSVDIGLMGINSVHLRELAAMGVEPADLFDECVAIYVGAWKLSKKLAQHGNTWWAIGAYHSETPLYNLRYQHKIWTALRAMAPPPATYKRETGPKTGKLTPAHQLKNTN